MTREAPRLEVDLAAIEHNARALVERLGGRGVQVMGVTKGVCGAPEVARAMGRGGVVALGDARVANIRRLRRAGLDVPLVLLRPPMLSQVPEVVAWCDGSLNSAPKTLRALAAAAEQQQRKHGVILMGELGDLREGVALSALPELAVEVEQAPGLTLWGVGANMACFAGAPPTPSAMNALSEAADRVEQAIGRPLAVISGGNSANLTGSLGGAPSGRVNQLRLGEAILLGRETLRGDPVPGLRTDAFRLVAEVIESGVKPSAPRVAGLDAFGVLRQWEDRGPIRRALLAVGRQDVLLEGLTPLAAEQRVLGGSSDILVLETGARSLEVGAQVHFSLNYGALLAAMTSTWVSKVYRPAQTPLRGSTP